MNWASERVLITGAGGVLGTALLKLLRELNTAGIFAPTRAECNLLDRSAVFGTFAEFKPTIVFHLAGWVAGIQGNLTFSGKAYHDNALINLNVVEAARVAGAFKVVAAGTVAVYSDTVIQPIREDMIGVGPPHGSESAYAQAKLGMLAHLVSYEKQYGLQYSYMICTNLFGENDRFDTKFGHVVPSLIARFYDAKSANAPSISIWGDGSPTRDFLYAADAAKAFIVCAGKPGGVFNVASGTSVAIRTLVDTVVEVSDYRGTIEWDTSKPSGQLVRSYDVSRLLATGWTPRTSLREGLKNAYDWYSSMGTSVRR